MSKKTVKCPKCGKSWQTDDARKTICDECRLNAMIQAVNTYNEEHAVNISYEGFYKAANGVVPKTTTTVVFCAHSGASPTRYLFRTPKPLKKGDVVATSRDPAICVCDSFEVPDDALKVIISSCGAKYPLSCVKGVYRLEEFTS